MCATGLEHKRHNGVVFEALRAHRPRIVELRLGIRKAANFAGGLANDFANAPGGCAVEGDGRTMKEVSNVRRGTPVGFECQEQLLNCSIANFFGKGRTLSARSSAHSARSARKWFAAAA